MNVPLTLKTIERTNLGATQLSEQLDLRNALTVYPHGTIVRDAANGLWYGDGATAGGIAIAVAATAPTEALPTMWVWDDDAGKVWCRMTHTAALDFVLGFDKVDALNPTANLANIGTLAVATAVGGTPTVTDISSGADDFPPIMSGGRGYFGGQHLLSVTNVAKTSHGLTGADIGKRFQETATPTNEFVITEITSVNAFQMVAKGKTLIGDAAYVNYAPGNGGLTPLDGQNGGLELTGYTATLVTDTEPSVRSNGTTSQWLVDGRPLQTGEIVRASKLDLVVTNRIVDIGAAFAYFVATGASATWDAAPIGFVENLRVTVYPWRQMAFDHAVRLTVAASVRLNNIGTIQFNPVGNHRWYWWPCVASKTVSRTLNGVAVTSIDFAQPVRIADAGLSADTTLEDTDTRITGVPSDLWINLQTAASTAPTPYTIAAAAGYDPTFEDAVPATRLANGTESVRISTTLKVYPYDRNYSSALPAGTVSRKRAWRSWTGPTTESDWWTCVRSGDKWLVYVSWLTDTEPKTITLPGYVTYTTATKTREYLCTAAISGRTVAVTPSAAYGLAILALQ